MTTPSPMPATRLKECRHGKMLYLHQDQYIGRSLDVYGEFSQNEAQIFDILVRPGDVVIEAGANIGAHTVHLGQRVGQNGLVLAFEPQRVLYYILCANLALNEQFNVHTYLAAAGKEPGVLKVPPLDYNRAGNFGGVSLPDFTEGENVPVTVLDDFKLPALRLLKVDVEGMEADVLEGARTLIATHRPFLYVENDRQDKSEALLTLIDGLGYDMWWHLPRLFNPDNFAGNPEDIFPTLASINLLCAPKELGMQLPNLRQITNVKDFWK